MYGVSSVPNEAWIFFFVMNCKQNIYTYFSLYYFYNIEIAFFKNSFCFQMNFEISHLHLYLVFVVLTPKSFVLFFNIYIFFIKWASTSVNLQQKNHNLTIFNYYLAIPLQIKNE